MLVKDIPYYAKFILSSSDGDCFSFSDSELLQYIKYVASDQPVNSFKIGQEIYIEPNTTKKYIITDIQIRHLVSDLEVLKYGIDLEDCTVMQGENKEWLFSILIKINVIE